MGIANDCISDNEIALKAVCFAVFACGLYSDARKAHAVISRPYAESGAQNLTEALHID